MKNSQIFNIILYTVGIGLIIGFFFVLFNAILSEEIFWLDLVVSIGVYTLFMFNIGRLFLSVEDMNNQWGGLGIRWFFMWTYSILAVAGMIVMYNALLDFSVQILAQATFLLLLLFGFFFYMIVNKKVSSVARQHQVESSGLNNMKELVSRFEIRISSKKPDKYIIKELEDIKENIRYLSPSLDNLAIDLENQFLTEMSEAISSINQRERTLNSEDMLMRLNSCNTVLKQRKNFRYN